MRRRNSPDSHKMEMSSLGGYALCHDVAKPVQQQRGVWWRPHSDVSLLSTQRHLPTVMCQLLMTELTQFCQKADQRLEAQTCWSFLEQSNTQYTHPTTVQTPTCFFGVKPVEKPSIKTRTKLNSISVCRASND